MRGGPPVQSKEFRATSPTDNVIGDPEPFFSARIFAEESKLAANNSGDTLPMPLTLRAVIFFAALCEWLGHGSGSSKSLAGDGAACTFSTSLISAVHGFWLARCRWFQRPHISSDAGCLPVLGDFQLVPPLQVDPKRCGSIQIACQPQSRVGCDPAPLVVDLRDSRHRNAQVCSKFVHTQVVRLHEFLT